MKKYNYILLSALLLIGFNSVAVNLPKTIDNYIGNNNILSVQLYKSEWKLSNPIIELNSNQKLLFQFDELTNTAQEYYYTIVHCDRNWEKSTLSQFEYLPNLTEFPVNDYEFSVNTKMDYVNYYLELPNENIQFKISGNYALVVFDYQNPDVPVIIKRFYVLDNKVNIDALIRNSSFESREDQEIDIKVFTQNLHIQNTMNDVKLVITQNNRTDNAITNLQPRFVGSNYLDYDYNSENCFKGENEFRYFDLRNVNYSGEGVAAINYRAPYYHAILEAHKIRKQRQYSFYKEMNGNFYIDAANLRNPDFEADYQMVHFTLELDRVLMGGGIYVFGAFTNWQCTSFNKMKYNLEKERYELTIPIKQGYYNFIYAWKENDESKIKPSNLEGSHSETENEYQVYFYYGKRGDRYDQLVGFSKFNSQTKRTFGN